MRIAYLDCFSGISGDMLLGALLDAGLSLSELEAELSKLKLSGYRLFCEKVTRGGIKASQFRVELSEQNVERQLSDIQNIIEQSELDDDVKSLGLKVFLELAEVEAGIHGVDAEQILFHEIGALDSIIDIIGSIIGLKKLGITAVYASKVQVGEGLVKCRHGELPVPAPATLELLKGIPIYSSGIAGELVTPTGAVLLKNISRSFGIIPPMKVESIGYGAGSKNLPIPNLLRIAIGEGEEGAYENDQVMLLETNLDDMNPEILAYTGEKLLAQGALDVWVTPIVMKKNRAGNMLSVITEITKMNQLIAVIFSETSALGLRVEQMERYKLLRKTLKVKTKYGEISVKMGKYGDMVMNIAPEYEDCRRAAERMGVPLKEVYAEVMKVAESYE